MKAIFLQINAIEYTKWSLITYKTVLGWAGVDVSGYENLTTYQQNYTSFEFTTPDHINVEP